MTVIPSGRRADRRRGRGSVRLPGLILLPAVIALALAGCGGNKKDSEVLPIRASFSAAPPSADPAVFFLLQSISGDLVIVDVMLRSTTAPLIFDAFTLEITFDPGLVQLAADDSNPAFDDTPFCGPDTSGSGTTCACNDSVSNCALNPTNNPLCLMNLVDANQSGTLLVGVSAVTGCPAVTTTAGVDTRLFRLGFVAASVGSSPIRFIVDADPLKHGDCEILLDKVEVPVTFDDGGATLSGAR